MDFCQGQEAQRRLDGEGCRLFPEDKAIMSNYGGPAPPPPRVSRKHKLTARAINVVSSVVLEYLRWFESPITFDRTDHPDSISKSGRFLLIIDPMVGTTRLTKALMDGAVTSTSYTLIPLKSWDLLVTNSKAAHIHFTEWSRTNNMSPSVEGNLSINYMITHVLNQCFCYIFNTNLAG
jgi:hypothetical protein